MPFQAAKDDFRTALEMEWDHSFELCRVRAGQAATKE